MTYPQGCLDCGDTWALIDQQTATLKCPASLAELNPLAQESHTKENLPQQGQPPPENSKEIEAHLEANNP